MTETTKKRIDVGSRSKEIVALEAQHMAPGLQSFALYSGLAMARGQGRRRREFPRIEGVVLELLIPVVEPLEPGRTVLFAVDARDAVELDQIAGHVVLDDGVGDAA